ncbi:phage gp6-like head-tail connector protein (plasmid) [Lactiplantibacillus plantarum]|uniref:head-tail connector protein n=1 Tax=Lactiplantibacillus plantarum TaxID=1590 RepID=UPI000FF8DDB6|nr:head-tail connector protein [Lactiplantibacillus plantarum]QAS31589.1 phage gp6-like head-tail connector protein [Lactiplantibacillus plantarum]
MADRVEITPKLQNATITVPANEVDSTGVSHWYLSTKQTSVTTSVSLKADEGCTFESDGSFDYQGSYNSQTETIPASHTDTVVFTLPDLDWADQYQPFTLTMSAVKATTSTTPTTTTPTTPTTTTPTGTTTPPSTTPTTQLDVLKNSLRIPLDLKDDDSLLKSYIDAATEYLASMLGEENVTSIDSRLNSKRAKVVINEIATLMYQNRGDDTVTKDFPFTLRALINQLKY